jgi:hypothetical protein
MEIQWAILANEETQGEGHRVGLWFIGSQSEVPEAWSCTWQSVRSDANFR